MKNTYLILIVLGLVTSCATTKEIHFNDNGTVILTTYDFEDPVEAGNVSMKELGEEIKKGGAVTGLSWSKDSVSAIIELANIDSLTNYMFVFNKGYFSFQYVSDTLLQIKSTDIQPFIKPEFRECCALYMSLTFDKEVKSVSSSVRRTKWIKRKNLVQVVLLNKRMRKGKKPLDLKIHLY